MRSATFVKLSLLSLVASCLASAIPNPEASAVVDSDSICQNVQQWIPEEAACTLATNAGATSLDNTSSLEKRATNFISPHTRRAFVCGLASGIITGANWVFDVWVKDMSSGVSLWRGGVSSSTNLGYSNVVVPRLETIYGSDSQYRGKAHFVLTGDVGKGGTSELVIKFTAEVFASAAETIIQRMIDPPTATLGGAPIDITSWSFDGGH
ncbi:hypothetical protein MBLNU13_g00003t1 [Cladosporium sp. NU13]